MFRDHHIIAVTPGGRRRYLEILSTYMLRYKDTIDEWRLWLNTTDHDDLDYMRTLSATHPHYITLEEPQIPITAFPGYSIYPFFRRCTDPKTVYIRFDDDIVYVHPQAIINLIQFRLENPRYFLVYANIINNAVCTHLHQQKHILSTVQGTVMNDCLDPLGWKDPHFAEWVHRTFLDTKPEHYLFQDRHHTTSRFSINCFAWMGRDFRLFQGIVLPEEEEWLSKVKTRELGSVCCVCGDALVAHYAFFPQREHMDTTNILDEYRKKANFPCIQG